MNIKFKYQKHFHDKLFKQLYITIQFSVSTVSMSKTVQFQTIQFSVSTVSMSKTVQFQTIHFSMSMNVVLKRNQNPIA